MRARVIGTPISVIDLSWSYHYSKATTTRGRMAADDETNQPATIDQAFFKQAKSKRYLAYTILGSLPPLSERQERQRVMSVSSLHDHLSWGFGSNITRGYNSITTSVSKNMEIKPLVEIYYRQVALYLSARRAKNRVSNVPRPKMYQAHIVAGLDPKTLMLIR